MSHSATSKNIEIRLIESLRKKGFKLTVQRLEILSLLARDMTHPGAGDIYRKVRKRVPQISMSTVYYTLDMMKKEGLIHEIEFYDRDNRYDVNVSHHINLICKKCGRIEDLSGGISLSYMQIQQKTEFQPVAMRYEYYGYCKECRRKRPG